MLNFKSLKTHLGFTYLDVWAVALSPFIRTSLRCYRGLHGWRHYFSLPYLLGFCQWFWFSLLFGVHEGNNCSQLYSQDHWALLNFWLEVEFLLGPIDGELNFSSSNINMCLGSAKQWSPKDEGDLLVNFDVKNFEIHRNEEITYLDRDVLSYSRWMANRLIR